MTVAARPNPKAFLDTQAGPPLASRAMARKGNDFLFEHRLRSARARQGMDGAERKPDARAFSAWGIGARVGTELVAAVAIGALLGWVLDWFCHTQPVFLMIFVPLGGAAGVLNVWRVLGPGKV